MCATAKDSIQNIVSLLEKSVLHVWWPSHGGDSLLKVPDR